VDFRELRAQLQRAAKRAHRFRMLAGFHEQLTEPIMAQLVVRIVIGHLAELGDALLQVIHGASSVRILPHFPPGTSMTLTGYLSWTFLLAILSAALISIWKEPTRFR